MITGDFIFHVDDINNPETRKILDLLESFRLEQHVDQPIHRDGHTLDLYITRTSEILINGNQRLINSYRIMQLFSAG